MLLAVHAPPVLSTMCSRGVQKGTVRGPYNKTSNKRKLETERKAAKDEAAALKQRKQEEYDSEQMQLRQKMGWACTRAASSSQQPEASATGDAPSSSSAPAAPIAAGSILNFFSKAEV